MQGDVKLAQSLQVASLAVRKLGIQQSVPSFARSYTVLSLTDRLLQITASASSASEAERGRMSWRRSSCSSGARSSSPTQHA